MEAQDWSKVVSPEDAIGLTGQSAETYEMEIGLTLIALVGIEDPLRDSVQPAIARCNHAGVDVRMVTGDNIDTAVAIAKQCGILRAGIDVDKEGNLISDRTAMTGSEFRKQVVDTSAPSGLNRAVFDEIWPYLRVLARSSPTDKYLLVSGIMDSELYKDATAVQNLGLFPDAQVLE